jgi:hypothetical protein
MRTLVAAVVLAVSMPAFAAATRPLLVTTQDHSLVEIDDCEHFYARTESSLPSRAQTEEQLPVPLAGVETLRVRSSIGGAVSIKGWDRPVARLTVCKYAVALNDADAKKTLHEVAVTSHNGEILAHGPENGSSRAWWVHMILRVPKHFAVDVASTSGGIAIRKMTGHVTARATNGGISVADCAGDSKLTADNGGISLDRMTGRVDAAATNGSISLKVSGTDAPNIEARTDDGGEIVCRAKICIDALARHTGSGNILRIGGGSSDTLIRLSTGAAPILIEQVR